MKIKLFLIFTLLCFVVSGSTLHAQHIWESKIDKYGNEIGVKIDIIRGNARSIDGIGANINRYGTEAKDLSDGNIETVSKLLISDYIGFFGVDIADLKFGYASKRNGKWNVSFSQRFEGIPVYGASIGYTLDREGRIIKIGGNLYPGLEVETKPSITAGEAIITGQEHFRILYNETGNAGKEPVLHVFPRVRDGNLFSALAYRFVLKSDTTLSKHIYIVDGHSGEVISDQSAYIHGVESYMPAPAFYVDGNVSRGYYPEHWNDTPLKSADLQGKTVYVVKTPTPDGIFSDVTSSTGDYSVFVNEVYVEGEGYWLNSTTSFNLSGSYVKIINSNSYTHNWFFDAPLGGTRLNHSWIWTKDETNVFHHANSIHDFYKAAPFNYDDMDYQMEASVHMGSSYNGAADRYDIYFGSDRNQEWAKSSDVIIHEYTHNVIAHLYYNTTFDQPWFIFDYFDVFSFPRDHWEARSMDEGLSDYWAASINDDNVFGESVLPGGVCPGTARNLMNNKQYDPSDFMNSCDAYENSIVISGASWRMRQNINDVDVANTLVFDAFEMTSDHAFTFREFLDNLLYSDDNDGDLSNGTPNIDDILYGFEHHGIYSTIPTVPPAKPKNLDQTASSGNPVLVWDANTEPDLQGYHVYRSISSSFSPNTKLTGSPISGTSYTDTDIIIRNQFFPKFYYRIKAIDNSSLLSNWSNQVWVNGMNGAQKTASSANGETPKHYNLSQNYPNPFNPETIIRFALPEAGRTSIIVYDLNGKEVTKLVDGYMSPGYHSVTWNASNVASGVYFYRIVSENFTKTMKMAVMK